MAKRTKLAHLVSTDIFGGYAERGLYINQIFYTLQVLEQIYHSCSTFRISAQNLFRGGGRETQH